MTILEIYVYFVLPLLVLGIGFGTLWLTRRAESAFDARRMSHP